MTYPLLVLCAALMVSASGVQSAAQQSAPTPVPAPAPPLTDFVGVYDYRGTTVAIVPKGDVLVAVIDQALYPLRHATGDEFRNLADTAVKFQRNEESQVTGLFEGADFFPLRTRSVPQDIRSLTVAREPKTSEYRYSPPARLNDGLETGEAGAVGFDVRTLEQLGRALVTEKYPNVHSVLLWRKGRLVFEDYFYGYDRDKPHQMRSATKSFKSALVGIAIHLGKIPRGEHQPIVEVLPWPVSSYANLDPRKKSITVGDLLSMRSGLACDDRDNSSPGTENNELYSSPDWARFTMDLPMVADPGTIAKYCSGGAHLAGRILEHVTGEDLLSFARTALFDPLGFKNYRWPHQPVPENAHTFGQLYLRPRDMLKFGVLFLNDGEWQGKQIIPRSWVARSTMPVTQIGSQRYGYLWWHQWFRINGAEQATTVDMIVATGNGGQKIFLVPSLELVAVFTGGNYNSTANTPPNEIMRTAILPELLKTLP